MSETSDNSAKPDKRSGADAAADTEQGSSADQPVTQSIEEKPGKPAKPETTAKPEATAKPEKPEKTAKPVKAATASAPPAGADKAAASKPAKPAPKPKPEDKPFASFIQDDLLPSLTKSLTERENAPVNLELMEGDRPVVGGRCWMVKGELPAGRRFWLCFESDAITSGKTIALAEPGSEPSLLESFLIDEKRINQALLESRLLQRLNGQKWFGGN